MIYRFYTSSDFDRQFKKLDKSVQIVVHKWIQTHLLGTDDPRTSGKQFKEDLKDYWRYRIGSYRLLVKICGSEAIIIAIDIDHRSVVYK